MYISTKGIFTGGQNAATSICTQRSRNQGHYEDQGQCKGKGYGQVHGPALGEALGTIRITQLCPRCVAERSIGMLATSTAATRPFSDLLRTNLLTRKTIVPISRRDPTISIVGYITDRAISGVWIADLSKLTVVGSSNSS